MEHDAFRHKKRPRKTAAILFNGIVLMSAGFNMRKGKAILNWFQMT
jgi:hypothetical protein